MHKLEPEIITLAYTAEHMKPTMKAAFERLEEGKGTTEDLIYAARHFREMGQPLAAKQLRDYVRHRLISTLVFSLFLGMCPGCVLETVDPIMPGCVPVDCATDCEGMGYGTGLCYAHEQNPDTYQCWCVDPSPGSVGCVEHDQTCDSETQQIFVCVDGAWLLSEPCDPDQQLCAEYLRPLLDGTIGNRARCLERDP